MFCELGPRITQYSIHDSTMADRYSEYNVSQKTVKVVFSITLSNFHQL